MVSKEPTKRHTKGCIASEYHVSMLLVLLVNLCCSTYCRHLDCCAGSSHCEHYPELCVPILHVCTIFGNVWGAAATGEYKMQHVPVGKVLLEPSCM